jgi:hypothetical protein
MKRSSDLLRENAYRPIKRDKQRAIVELKRHVLDAKKRTLGILA